MISRDDEGADFSRKQEMSSRDNGNSNSKASSSSRTTLSRWSCRFKDPRIVRVSKALGGKDRHSKVCTVRGLRDRRVRLSVPTAIQLYDLQDRLGLNQPSKVVDWLLNVAKNEIDGLPPLQIPQGMLNPILPSHFINNAAASEKHGLKNITTHGDFNDPALMKLQDMASAAETSTERNHDHDDNEEHDQSWTRSEEDQRHDELISLDDHDQNQGDHHHHGQYVSTTSNFLPRQSNDPSPMAPYNSSFVRWDPSNLTLSHQPQLISLGLSADHQNEDLQSFSLVQLPSTLSVYQHGIMNTQPYFPSQISSTSQPSAFHTSSHHHLSVNTSTQPLRPFHFSVAADLLPSQNNAGDEQNKRD